MAPPHGSGLNAVSVTIAGTTYRLVASADEAEVAELAEEVQRHLPARGKGGPQALVLAALSLAHELRSERAKSAHLRSRAKTALTRIQGQIANALAGDEPLRSGDEAANVSRETPKR